MAERKDGPARFQFTATWTVELPDEWALEPLAPRKMSVLIQHGAAKLLELAGKTGRVGAVTVTCRDADQQPNLLEEAEGESG
jgi:hypothetical protein